MLARTMSYRIIRAFARLLLGLFYRRIEVVGSEHIPARGPVIITANHHNSLVDPMLVMTAVPRPLVILAAAPLFRNPLIGPFLRLVGGLPVLRRHEGVGDPARNDAMFGAVAASLRRGGAVLLFPEGRTQPEPVLLPLRTGAARMLLGAATEELPVTLLPLGLVFHEPGTFRTGWALVLVGPPVRADDCVTLYRSEPERAVRELTERLTARRSGSCAWRKRSGAARRPPRPRKRPRGSRESSKWRGPTGASSRALPSGWRHCACASRPTARTWSSSAPRSATCPDRIRRASSSAGPSARDSRSSSVSHWRSAGCSCTRSR